MFTALSQTCTKLSRGWLRNATLLALAFGMFSAGVAQAQITTGLFTDQSNRVFSNITSWNFVQGYSATNPVAFSSSSTVLTFQGFGSLGGVNPQNDFNLTMTGMNINYFSPNSNINIGNSIGGTYTFVNNGTSAAFISVGGSGGGTGGGNFGAQTSAGFVLGANAAGTANATMVVNSASSSNGIAALNTNFGGVISSNMFNSTATGTDTTNGLHINTGGLANTGVVILGAANTFSGGGTLQSNSALAGYGSWTGGVTLTSGNLDLTNAGAIGIFGNTYNTLTINSTTSGAATISASAANTFINPIVTAAGGGDLVITGGRGNEAQGALALGGFLGNGVSGAGNVVIRPAGSGSSVNFQGINTYTGSTTVGAIQYASNGSPSNPGTLRIQGAVGQITSTSSYTVNDGAVLEINYNAGNSVNNSRISSSAPITINNGYLQIVNSAAAGGTIVNQSVGTVNAGGLATILANANVATASTSLTINNLVRSGNGVVVIAGNNLGTAAVAVGTQEGNVFANNLNGVSTSTAAGLAAGGFVGGGFYSSVTGGTLTSPATNLSILPWAFGVATGTGNLIDTSAGGFVTYGASSGNFGFRPLAGNEYNITNDFTTAGAQDNMKIVGAINNPTAPTTVNSIYFAFASGNLGGANPVTIASGALASALTPATISAPLVFPGEAFVTVTGAANSTNVLNVSGGLTATALTKSGFGILNLSGTNTITGPITVDAGTLQISTVGTLGGATSLAFGSNFYYNASATSVLASTPTGLLYTGTGTETLSTPIVLNAGRAMLRMSGAAGNLTLGGAISGPGGLNIDPIGAGTTLRLTGTNTYTGGTRIGNNGGNATQVTSTITLNGDAALGAASGPLTFGTSTGTTFQLTGQAWNTSRQIAMEGSLGSTGTAGQEGFDTAGQNSTWSGQILGGGNIVKIDSVGGSTWTIASNNNPYTGTITLGTTSHAGGTLKVTGEINSASVTFGPGSGAGVAGTYTLDLSSPPSNGSGFRNLANLNTSAGFTQAHTVQLGLNAGAPVDLRVGAGTFGGAAGVIQGNGSLVVDGGTLTLTNGAGINPNTFTGDGLVTPHGQVGLEIWNGTLSISNDGQLGNASNAIAIKGGTLQVTSNLTTSRDLVLQSSAFTLVGTGPENHPNVAGITFEVDGNVVGSGGFEFSSGGTLYLTGNNTTSWVESFTAAQAMRGQSPYGGIIKVNTGTLKFNNDTNLGDSGNKICILVNGNLDLASGQGTQIINRFIAYQNATNTASITVEAASTMQLQGSLYSGSTSAQSLTKNGAGSMILDANWSNYVGNFLIGNATAATGNVSFTANTQVPRVNVVIAANSTATLDMSGFTNDMGAFSSAAGTTLALGSGGRLNFGFNNVANNFGALAGNAGSVIAGTVTGDGSAVLNQVGTGPVTITGSIASTGGYNVMGNGNLIVSGTGTIAAQGPGILVGTWANALGRGAMLQLDSTQAHLDPTQVVYLNSAELSVVGAAVPIAQSIDSLIGTGFSIVTAGTNTAAANVSFNNVSTGLTRNSNGTFLFRSGSTATLGSGATGGTNSNLFFGNISNANLIGGGGGPGTAQISILPFAVGDDAAAGAGSTFVTYGPNGIRTLQAAAGEYNTSLLGAGATDNVLVTNTVPTTLTLSGGVPKTVNSLIVGGTAGTSLINSTTTEALVVTSGALLASTGNVWTNTVVGNVPTSQVAGIQTASLQTGNGNTQQLNVFTTYGDLAIGSLIASTGGLVKSGFGSLYLTNAANTYTGGTVINGGTLAISSLGSIHDTGSSTLTMGGGFLKWYGGNATLSSFVNLAGGNGSNGLGGGIYVASGNTFSLTSGNVFGAGGLVKEGSGTLLLQGSNNFGGPVTLNTGQLALDGPAALGFNSRVLVGPEGANGYGVAFGGSQAGASFKFTTAATYTQEWDVISANPAIGIGFDTNSNNVVLSGVVNSPSNNGRGLYKLGGGDLRLTSAELYTGATQVFGGTLTLGGPNGSIMNSGINGSGNAFNTSESTLVNFGAGLVLDNTGAGNANSTRIPSGFTTAMSGGTSATNGGLRLQGGNFTLRGSNTGVAVNEYAGEFDIFAGTVTLQGNGSATVLSSGRLIRTDSATIGLIRGTGLGTGAAGAGVTNWFLVDQGGGSTQLTGAGGAKGTPYINILPGFAGDISATGTGTDLVTYSPDVGVRLLAAGEYKANSFDGSFTTPNYDTSRAANIRIDASGVIAPSFTTWVDAIKVSGSGSSVSGSADINLISSTILATGGGVQTITVPTISHVSGNTGYDIYVAGGSTLNLNTNMYGASGGGTHMAVYGGAGGSGVLNLGGSFYGNNAGNFGVLVGEGATLNLVGASAALNPISLNVNVGVGGTLNLGGLDRTIASINTQAAIGTFNLNQVSDGTINLASNKLTLYDNVTSLFTGQITSSTAGTLTKGFFSAGTTTLTQPQAGFNGTVEVFNGTMQLASGGTLPNVNTFNIRGGTLALNNQDDLASAGLNNPQRISSTATVNLAGSLTLVGNGNRTTVGTGTTVGTLNLIGAGTVTSPDQLTINNLNRAANKGTMIVSAPAVLVKNFDNGTGTGGTGWTANTNASFVSATTIQLTPATNSNVGSVWYNQPVSTRAFTASFTYSVPSTTGSIADGMTFGFQNNALTTVGGGGGSLGYAGIGNSAAMQINIFPSNTDAGTTSGGQGTGLGVLVNGATPAHVQTSNPISLSGAPPSSANVTINYDGTTMTITMTQGTALFSSSFPLNIANEVGASAFMGFTGATGGLNAQQQISNFSFSSEASGLGTTLSTIGGAQVKATNIDGSGPLTALKGGGGAAGTFTVSILPWAWSSTAGGWLTYDATNGLRPLNTGTISGSEYNGSLTAGGLNDNVRTVAATTLAAPVEVNSLINTSGNVSGAFDLTLRSGALAVTGAATIGNVGNNLKTGTAGANNVELVVFNTAATTMNYSIGTTAGVTKYGGGALTLAGVNTFTGGLNINGGSIAYSNANQLAAGNTVTFGIATNAASPNGLGLQYTGSVLNNPAITNNFVTNSFGGIIGPAAQVTTLNNTISGSGVFAYNNTVSSSIYEVNGNNTYTGDTYINFGQVSIAGNSAFGGNATSAIQINSGVNTDGIDLRANWTTSHPIHMRSAGGINTNGFTATLNGPVIGTAGLTEWGRGTIVLTAPNPTTGAITMNAGTLTLTGNGAIVQPPVLGFGTQLILDDSGTHYSDRLPQNAALSGNNTEIKLIGNASTTTEQVIGSLTLGSASVVTAVSNGQPTILRLGGTFTRSTASSILFRGTNLGTAVAGTAGVANVMIFNPFNSGAALTGGGGPAGNTAISVIAGAFGDTSATGLGTQLVTYDLNKGVRLLNPATEYAVGINNGTSTADNVHVSASNTGIANATTVNALWIDGTGAPVTVSGAGTLTIGSGGILVSGAGNVLGSAVVGGTVANAIAVGGTGDLSINTAIPSTNTGGLIKSGAGNLTLNAANLYGGTTYLSGGTLTLGIAGAIPTASTFRVVGYGNTSPTLQSAVNNLTLSLSAATSMAFDGDMTFAGSNNLTITATGATSGFALDSATRAITVAGTGSLTLNGVMTSSANSAVGIGLIKNGPGQLILTGANTYGGVAATDGFYLSQTVVNGGELRINNTTGSGTGGSTVVVNSGGVLSGSGTMIPTQQLQARNTIVIGTGATIAPGPGSPGTLTAGATTTPGVTTATVQTSPNSFLRFLYTSSPAPAVAAFDTGASQTAGSATGNNELVVNGNLQLDNATKFQIFGNVADFATGSSQTYSFLYAAATTVDGGLANDAFNINSNSNPGSFDTSNFVGYTPGLFTMQVHNVGGNVYFNINTVPEPSTLLLCGGAAGAFGWWRRRRSARKAEVTAAA
jgi:autotransporter-associated beta strand protein